MDASFLWPLIRSARWYAGKSSQADIIDYQVLDWYSEHPVRVRSEFVAVRLQTGITQWYHLPISYRSDQSPSTLGLTELGYAYDATEDPQAITAILNTICQAKSTANYSGRYCAKTKLVIDLPAHTYQGEQSNTSIFLGDTAILKIFRKLEPGRNIDIELHQALADTTAVAQLYGWIDTPKWDLCMLVEALPQPIDGYVLASSPQSGNLIEDARLLGALLAEVHAELRRLGTGIGSGAELATVFNQHACLVAERSAELATFLPAIQARFDRLSGNSYALQRIHGDFHLGQTLKTPIGWRIVDFEGEPMKSIAERRAMDSPWRDVAGMFRSIYYAAHARGASLRWSHQIRTAFLSGFLRASGGQSSELLAAYELDRAIYEVGYELANRPHLVSIPLSFIAATLKEN